MKLVLSLFLFAASAMAQPTDVQFSTLGPWTLCAAFPKYCVAEELRTYVVLVKASSAEVVGFRYRVEYVTDGVTHIAAGVFAREDSDVGVSHSAPLTLGRIDALVSVTADELVVR